MKNPRRTIRCMSMARGLLLMFALACMTVPSLNACTAQSRYKLKTIVFTGVPPLEPASEEQEAAAEPQVVNANQLAKQQRHREAMVSQFWTHGPFAAGECERCHALGQSTSFGAYAGSTISPGDTASGRSSGSRLVVKSTRLCTTCHEQHDRSAVRQRGLNHHRPAATGRCMDCHHPHQSLRRFMLRGTDTEMCGQCHNLPMPDVTHTDAGDQMCTSCHNAHVSTEPALLKSERNELSLLYGGPLR